MFQLRTPSQAIHQLNGNSSPPVVLLSGIKFTPAPQHQDQEEIYFCKHIRFMMFRIILLNCC